jgi:prepilin-type N-terminal cleavage/methylation domain-containing protein
MKLKHLNNELGFTLLEVIVTTIIIGFAFAAITDIVSSVDSLNRRSRNYVIATEYTQRQVENYRNAGFNAIPASADFTASLPPQLGSPRSGTATFTDLSPAVSGLKSLNITIQYTDGASRTVKISTLVAQRGINR